MVANIAKKQQRRTDEILHHLLNYNYDASACHLPHAHADRTCGMGGKVRKDEEGREMNEVEEWKPGNSTNLAGVGK